MITTYTYVLRRSACQDELSTVGNPLKIYNSDRERRYMAGRAGLSVPPGFRFHPTEEELLYYYLKKKVSYEPIDLDVIREVDLNKLEPWDLKEKCGIGSGPQNDWYFFSHKDKKYPTGTRTNRATAAGFWKATGRDKAIYHSNSKRIGMRKTLVFYTGRAPRGHKTDWIMHEYRLDDDHHQEFDQEDGWVICRVFTKKNQTRSFQEQPPVNDNSIAVRGCKHYISDEAHYNKPTIFDHNMTTSIHLPRLHSLEATVPVQFSSSHNQLIPSTPGGSTASPEKHVFAGDWSFLDRLLTTNQSMDHNNSNTKSHLQYFPPAVADMHMLQPSLSFPFPTNFHG